MNPAVATTPSAWAGNPVTTLVMLSLISLAPFLLMMSTSFLKFSVVFSILRNALGAQQVPPNPVVMGLSVIMTVYVMSPVWAQISKNIDPVFTKPVAQDIVSSTGAQMVFDVMERSKEPFRDFLSKHTHPKEKTLFHDIAARMRSEDRRTPAKDVGMDDMLVLIPAFTVSELSEAFMIGFLIFLPFLVIDMVISNILLALGMHMLSPTTVSMPFKLLLFIMIDGWDLLVRGLVQGYI